MIPTRTKITFAVLAAIGSIGVFGEAAKLHNSLVHSYPFKMMTTPPFEFYASVGELGYYIAVTFGILSILLTFKLPRFLTCVVPVVVCPVIYWLVFESGHIVQGFSRDQLSQRNFEGYTGDTARYEFGFEVLTLLFFGSIIGTVIGVLIHKLATVRESKLV